MGCTWCNYGYYSCYWDVNYGNIGYPVLISLIFYGVVLLGGDGYLITFYSVGVTSTGYSTSHTLSLWIFSYG